MPSPKKLLAICGSTARESVNLKLIRYIANHYSSIFTTATFNDISGIPHFSPDVKTEDLPSPVLQFLQAIDASHAVLISTPEYAMGVPGTLKNAIDWTVGSMVFSKKPVALITASSLGNKGHAALLETLQIIECYIPAETQLIISAIKTKIDYDGNIIHPQTAEAIDGIIHSLFNLIN